MPDSTNSTPDLELRALVDRALSSSYELGDELGRGGMGIVYRAKDRRLKRTIAIKVLPPELSYRSEIRTRFLREAETAAQLSHPNIVPIYSVDEAGGIVYFVMACVDGVNLARKLHDNGRLPVSDTRRILKEVGEALAYAHARGVIHRDIKPDNILLEADTGRAMVTDFGIARAVQEGDARLTATGVAIGTPAFMSPEQAAGDKEIDGRSDLYSLGIVAYQMLTGELPFSAGSTASMLMKHLTERAVPVEQERPEVPPDFAATVMTLLEKEPERRFPSASSFVLMLDTASTAPYVPPVRAATTNLPVQVPSPVAPPPAVPHQQTRSGQAAAAAYTPSPDDIARWSAPPVEEFRKKFIFFAAVNSVVLLASIFTGIGLTPITVFWSMYMAYKYAGLWTTGYDWRDVFRQPRTRTLIDVATDTVDEARGIFDKEHRQKRRSGRTLIPPPTPGAPSRGLPAGAASARIPDQALGRYAAAVRQAEEDRQEIRRIVGELSPGDRKLVGDVIPSSDTLFQRVQSLAFSGADLDRQANTGDAVKQVDTQIKELEDQANPFDRARSEERVRRLANLKRQRRTLLSVGNKRDETQAKLERVALTLQNMRFDLVRLQHGGISADHLTSVTEKARAVAAEVDAVVSAADEVRSAVRPAARRG
ncbi:MAG: serine/threonine-protein kinase [Gemmatimonadaceae bacterium]